jgi:MFS-type transporter involved in bile tolerance (Atg22 family)
MLEPATVPSPAGSLLLSQIAFYSLVGQAEEPVAVCYRSLLVRLVAARQAA